MEDSLVRLLAGDDLRSTGRVEEVIQLVRQDPARIEELVRGLEAEEAVVRMRAADALEKITAGDHALLQPYKTQLLEVARTAGQQEVRWHLALMLPRLRLTRQERDAALDCCEDTWRTAASSCRLCLSRRWRILLLQMKVCGQRWSPSLNRGWKGIAQPSGPAAVSCWLASEPGRSINKGGSCVSGGILCQATYGRRPAVAQHKIPLKPVEPKGRFFMNGDERKQKMESYASAFARLVDALRQFPSEMWHYKPTPERWSIHETVVHIADSEANSYIRCRKCIAEPGSTIVGYDEALWSKTLRYQDQSLEEALELFRLLRLRTLKLIQTLPEEAWSNTYEHPENGTVTLEDWLGVYERHIPEHIEQMWVVYREWVDQNW